MVDLELSEFANILSKTLKNKRDSILYVSRTILVPLGLINTFNTDDLIQKLNKLFIESQANLWSNKSVIGGKFLLQEVKKTDKFFKIRADKFDRYMILIWKDGITKDMALGFLDKLSYKAKVNLADEKITFNKQKSIIYVGERVCKIIPKKNEYDLCRLMFEKNTNEHVEWTDVAELMTGKNFNLLDEKKYKRMVQDTVYSINRNIQRQINTKSSLFSWKNKGVIRNF